jgi:hypothetical protein
MTEHRSGISRSCDPQPFHKAPRDQSLVALGESTVNGTAPAPVHGAKNAGFRYNHRSTQPRHSTKMNPGRNVADLINPELPGFNRFSNHGLHSVARTNS